jgi:hypothetical protein
MDPSPATMQRVLAFVHPLWMLASLGLAVATASLGLRMRRRRAAGLRVDAELRRRHLRWGRTTLVGLAVGFALGPTSMVWLRGEPAFDSFHGVLGLIAAGLFAWTGWSGRALSRGDREARSVHRLAAAAGLGFALLAAIAGFVLLP